MRREDEDEPDGAPGRSPSPDPKATITSFALPTLKTLGFGRQETTATVAPPPLDLRRRLCFIALSGAAEGEVFELPPGSTLLLGRAGEADIRLQDDGVSRLHARITVEADRVVLEDLQSRNGTFVGGERITRRELAVDDLVHLGSHSSLKLRYIDSIEDSFRERLISAAIRDGLTGVFNRRCFEERLVSECASARRHQRSLSLLLLDVDGFKQVNDQHGHLCGDTVLQGVAGILQSAVRLEDMVFRYGGEEFAVLLRETDLPGALRLAERLRRDVNRASFDAPKGPLQVSVSIGAAVLRAGRSDTDLLALADEALLRAKREGKNRVIAAEA